MSIQVARVYVHNRNTAYCTTTRHGMQLTVRLGSDREGNLQVLFAGSYEPTGPFGAKSIGEVVCNTPPPAITHAICNATGVRCHDLPLTAEKILLIQNKRCDTITSQ